ncbi:MAG: hypothetical protein HY268_17185 [Deltaproteobacteria bacterium]|nr:hypothetical protein [Deltaproteobacteria bacterium]
MPIAIGQDFFLFLTGKQLLLDRLPIRPQLHRMPAMSIYVVVIDGLVMSVGISLGNKEI